MTLYYNPLDKKCKFPLGAVKEGETVYINVTADSLDCKLFLREDKSGDLQVYNGEKLNENFSFKIENLKVGLYWYAFELDGYLYGRSEDLSPKLSDNLSWYQLSIYDSSFSVPNWFKGGIIYQIFPDRFARVGNKLNLPPNQIAREWGEQPYYKPTKDGKILNNDFFGGNFKGVESKLNYLKELGVTVIYFNPITKAYSNHRYDTGDYLKIDEILGTEEEFTSLCKTADSLGIKVILDGVFNHTGDDSVYFNRYGNYPELGAFQSKNSIYYDWYLFEKHPKKYKCWWDILILPTINKNSHSFENFIAGNGGVIEKYMRLGACGYRLDVVDELPSSFVKKIRSKIKTENSNAVLIGEVWEDATNKIAYDTRKEYFLGKELDSVMNYPLKNAIIDYVTNKNSTDLKNLVLEQINNYPKPALDALMNIIGTHDTARILTVLGRKIPPVGREAMSKSKLSEMQLDLAIKRLFITVTLQFTLYGVPSIYYGDEVGLEGEADPFNRACYPWGNENQTVLSFYKKLTEIRRSNDVFIDGEVELLMVENGLFSFKREKNGTVITVIVNVGEYKYDVSFDNEVEELFTKTKNKKFTIEKFDFKIFKA